MKRTAGAHLIDWARSNCNRRNQLLTPAGACASSKLSRISRFPNAMPDNIPMSHIRTPLRDLGGRLSSSIDRSRAALIIIAVTLLLMVSGSSCSIDSSYVNDQPPSEGSSQDDHSHTRWNFGTEQVDELVSYTEALMKNNCRDIPGLSMAIVSNGKRVHATGLGYADVEAGIPATSNTLFCVASLSKAFTSALLARLIERQRNRISWDTKVWDILKDTYPFMDDYVTRHVTIRDLLSHRTGIQRHDMLWISGMPTQEDVFRKLKCMKSKNGFRGAAYYNNILYALAGHVAEVLGGATWEELVKRELLDPLGMMDTTFLRNGKEGFTRAKQYVHLNRRTIDIGDPFYVGAQAISPAIGVCSNARDMASWMEFHLSLGKTSAGHVIITEDMMKEMHRGQVSTQHMIKPTVNKNGKTLLSYDQYGLGWFIGYYKGYKTLMHYGSYPGYYSMITMVPSMNFSIFTSINGGAMSTPFSINTFIHTRALDLAMIHRGASSPNTTPDISQCRTESAYLRSCGNNDILPMRHLKRYTGIYYNAAFGNLSFSIEEDEERGNLFVMTYNALRFRAVFQLGEDYTKFCIETLDEKYRYTFPPNEIKFTRNIVTDIIQSVSVPSFSEDDQFVKLPEDVSFEEWSLRGCDTSEPPCDKTQTLATAAKADVMRVTKIILLLCILILWL